MNFWPRGGIACRRCNITETLKLSLFSLKCLFVFQRRYDVQSTLVQIILKIYRSVQSKVQGFLPPHINIKFPPYSYFYAKMYYFPKIKPPHHPGRGGGSVDLKMGEIFVKKIYTPDLPKTSKITLSTVNKLVSRFKNYFLPRLLTLSNYYHY